MIRLTALFATIVMLALFALAGCTSQADKASQNISTAADNFEVQRRVVFYNGITDTYLLEAIGRCSLGNHDTARRMSVTCKVADNMYVKHFLGLSDNVTFFAEQLDPLPVSTYRTRIIFRPTTIVPAAELDLGSSSQNFELP